MHVKLTGEERSQDLKSHGVPGPFAELVSIFEIMTASGGEARENHVVEEVTGRPPKNFDTFVQENKAVWQ